MENFKHSYKTDARSATSLCVYNVGYQRCRCGYCWGPGVRDHFLIHHVTRGKGTFTVEGRTFQVASGDTFLAYPETTISYRADRLDPWEYYWVGFQGGDARLLLDGTGFSPETPVLRVRFGEGLRDRLLAVYQSRGPGPAESVRMTSRLYELMAFLMERAPRCGGKGPAGGENVRRALDYIANHFSHPITVSEVAAAVGISRSWMYRMFCRHLGMPPVRYLTTYRLRQACALLQDTSLSIKAVSYSSGFEDPLYFSRMFKKEMGVSPRAYAERHRGKTGGPAG